MMLTIEISKTFFETGLSPAEIFQSPVLKEQSRILTSQKAFKAVHVYSVNGHKTPIFFVHGGNIGPEAYVPLAQKLPEDQPFYCFENYNIYNPDARIRGIAPVAEKYIELLRNLAPRGPYIMGGWSYGGLVAFEMALQLERMGETVEHLYMLDPGLIITPEEKQLREKFMEINNYREYLSKDSLFERFRSLGLLDRLIENNREVSRDVQEYVPAASYRGEATLFKSIKEDPANLNIPPEVSAVLRRLREINRQKRDNGFGEYVSRLRIIEIPEIHDGFMRGDALDMISSVIGQVFDSSYAGTRIIP
jgi:thioesterase domain-containing protein